MKISKLLAAALLAGSVTFVFAEVDLTSEIDAINKASQEERPALMNQLKAQLQNMSEEDRVQAMDQIRERLKVKEGSGEMFQHQNQMMNQNGQMGSNRPAGSEGHGMGGYGGGKQGK